MCLCSLLGAASPLLLGGCFHPMPGSGLRCTNTRPAWALRAACGQAPLPAHSLASHMQGGGGGCVSHGAAVLKSPQGPHPSPMFWAWQASWHVLKCSASRESLCWSHRFRLSVLPRIMEINPLPAPCVLSPPTELGYCCSLQLLDCHVGLPCCLNHAVNGFRAGTVC